MAVARTGHAIRIVFASLLLATCISAHAADYTGSYHRGTVDTMEQIAILDDQTFCFAVMAGSLDLLAGGRWKPAANPAQGIELQQVKPDLPAFQVLAVNESQTGTQVIFDFFGHSFADASGAVFAVSDSATAPENLRPLFPAEKTGWSPSYALPALDVTKARYFYLGYATGERSGQPQWQVSQYALQQPGTVRIAFDRNQAMQPLHFTAQMRGDVLYLDGEEFGSREPLPQDLLKGLRQDCITPALAPASASRSTDGPPGHTVLMPLRTFPIDPQSMQGTPWFADPFASE